MDFIGDEVDSNGFLKGMISGMDEFQYGSAYSHIFIHNSCLAYSNTTNRYANVLFCCPLYRSNTWHSALAITTSETDKTRDGRDRSNKVVTNSNSFYWEDKNASLKLQNARHHIYDRLVFTYHRMKNYPRNKCITIDDECLFLANTFSGVNSGHELSIILDTVSYYRNHSSSIKRIVVLKAINWFPNNLILLKLLLGPEGSGKLMEVEWNKVYKFSCIHMFRSQIINITYHPRICEELRQLIMKSVSPGWKSDAKVVLLKTHRDKNVVTVSNQLICEKLLVQLEKEGWLIINPETADVLQMCATLMKARTIVFSHGSILYTHMMFFNPAAKLKWIAVGSDKLSGVYNPVASRHPATTRIFNRDLDHNVAIHDLVYNAITDQETETPAVTITVGPETTKTVTHPNPIVKSMRESRAAVSPAPSVIAARQARIEARTKKRPIVPAPYKKIPTVNRNVNRIKPSVNRVNPPIRGGSKVTNAVVVNNKAPASTDATPWKLNEPGFITTSGLLQEHFFVHSVLEAAKGYSFIVGVNHSNGQSIVEVMDSIGGKTRRTYSILFPMKRVNLIRALWRPVGVERKYKYYFRGLLSGIRKKQWVKTFEPRKDSRIEHNHRGRSKDKYVFDRDYYDMMCNSQFVLAPTDVYPWSYRFLEAIMCRCIPILEASDTDIIAKAGDFHFYRTNEQHVWREDWIEENLKKFMKLHTLSDPTHDFNKIMDQIQ